MSKTYRHWARGFLALLLAFLVLCGGIVYTVDPCLYYRMPEDRLPVFFNERYQFAGLIKNIPADTVLLGTSMTANYRSRWIEDLYHTSGLRITIPDGHFSEFDQIMDLLFREHPPKRVLFALDLNVLTRNDGGVTDAMPDYLYDRDPLNDVKYLLNKDCLYYSLYTLWDGLRGGGQTLDEGFTWDKSSLWGKYEVLRTYDRPPIAAEQTPEDAYLDATAENLAVMDGWFRAHPDTIFKVFLSPYSILFWDQAIRQGDLDARLKALELAFETLTGYPNVYLQVPLFCQSMVTSLGNYCDYIHHSGEAARWVLGTVCGEKFVVRAGDVEKALADWREFVVNYDYDALWDQEFWDRWNEEHDAPPAWYEG